ncbi:deoxyribodipyrimidine photolyase [Lujinxingia litoralis]|uniref:Deoxyribodipyrimidine photo-lyase n=1 Tax=Lujinxingia litoralis TaxID=2211119 RepID=A0A328C227_9DELT|nr:deoxyribodipyrimidine photolyase [Lujinxingia litoralis]RAL20483.1 deoxyribodipyrimidine photolyase [Lujinxingia litoralis]
MSQGSSKTDAPQGGAPAIRVRALNSASWNPSGEYVLYWMVAHRRPSWNFALDRALFWAQTLGKPLIVLEPLRHGYPWASDRFHAFVLQGMAAQHEAFEKAPLTYYPFVEREDVPGSGLLEALGARAAVIVSDDFPAFFLPRMQRAVARRLDVRLEVVDSNGVVPIRLANKLFARAYDFRRFLHRSVQSWVHDAPRAAPFDGVELPPAQLPAHITERWPRASSALLNAEREALAELPIDHSVPPVDELKGGWRQAEQHLQTFLNWRLDRYHKDRNAIEDGAASGLSPYLHFGHISAHQIFGELTRREGWSPEDIQAKNASKREGFWSMSPGAESFLDEVLTWREVGFNFCTMAPGDYDRYESLPAWAQQTLAEHADDPREHLYSLGEFEAGHTHDELWNAAQMELVHRGVMHNYLRMLWGKKILHWSASPEEALAIMIELNNKYALDGRDPNSYSGIFWVLGRYDRAWGPEREVFGKIRYMTSESTRRKMRVEGYIQRWAAEVEDA